MKNIIINEANDMMVQIQQLIDYILEWNGDKKVVLYPYNGLLFKEHIKLIYPYGKIKGLDFKLIENDNEFINFIKTENLDDYNILIASQFISDDIHDDFIKIKEDNLQTIFPIDKNVVSFEYHKKQFSNNQLIHQYMKNNFQILNGKKLWID